VPGVVILYEDALAPGAQPKDYGPHLFVLWCLVDRTGKPVWELGNLVAGIAKKGKEQVRAACRRSQLFDRGTVVAVYDNDHVRDLPGLAASSQRSRDVAEALRQEAAQPARTTVRLLHRNMETVVDQLLECSGPDSIGRRKPKPLERDLLLGRATGGGAPECSIRKCVLEKMPSLKCLVDTVAAALAE